MSSTGSIDEIVPGLFLSGRGSALSKELLGIFHISHIIQATEDDVAPYPDEFNYKVIVVQDQEDEVIIKHFQETYTFIQEALDSGGKVLVHCLAGISRSASIVCAYLMKSRKLTVEQALVIIKASRPFVEPNYGFMDQLNLYFDIDYDISPSRTLYRRFLISAMAEDMVNYGHSQQSIAALTANPTSTVGASSAVRASTAGPFRPPGASPSPHGLQQHQQHTMNQERPLKCKKCRRALVAFDSIVNHTPGSGQNSFQYRKRDATLNVTEAIQSNISTIHSVASTVCQSYFIEPSEWIKDWQALTGRICCPKCDSKLGTFNWSGEQCSCGAWITPAFMIAKGKVDA